MVCTLQYRPTPVGHVWSYFSLVCSHIFRIPNISRINSKLLRQVRKFLCIDCCYFLPSPDTSMSMGLVFPNLFKSETFLMVVFHYLNIPKLYLIVKILFINLFVCVHAHEWIQVYMYAMACVWRTEDTLLHRSVPSFYYITTRDWAQISRLDCRHFHCWLNLPHSPSTC